MYPKEAPEKTGIERTEPQTEVGRLAVQARQEMTSGDMHGSPAFAALYQEFYHVVYSATLSVLKNHHHAEDRAQDVFLRVMEKLEQLKDPDTFPGWLRVTATRLSINYGLRQARRRQVSWEQFDTQADDEFGDPVQGAIHREEGRLVTEKLAAMRPLIRIPMEEFYFDDRPIAEIAGGLEIPEGTVKRRLHQGRNELRDALDSAHTPGATLKKTTPDSTSP